MEHVVFHPGPDGAPAFRRCAGLDDAVRYVEHLRNVEAVTEVSVYALTPVPLAFRAYYRVEVPGDGAAPDAASVDAGLVDAALMADVAPADQPMADQPIADVPMQAEPMSEVEAQPVPALAADVQFAEVAPVGLEQPANGKRSLGFFAH